MGVFAEPLLSAGPFFSAEIESDGQIVGDLTTVKARVQLKSELPPNSQFFIKLPDSLFYHDAGGAGQLQCQVNNNPKHECFKLV